ncbi:MAG: serine/threonine-protein kinase [Planctomycetaceae bacterium]|nr:serine/threonine-protein kinase [Planctomycetaceae bacterium]
MNFLKKLFARRPRVPKVDIAKRFELIARTGQGSMSKVWRSRDMTTGRSVAVKILDVDKTKRFEARFAVAAKKPTEGEIAMQLRHPHIVKTIEHGITTKNEQYLVMDFIEGNGLSYLIDLQNDAMKQNRIRFMIELGEAIEYFHRENWIHRDICPRNVMIDRDLTVKLIDFGLVVPNTPTFQAPGNRTGTANYMAPELIKRQRTDQRLDIFSYAITCFEMCAKRLPWEAAETLEAVTQHINAPPVDLAKVSKDIDPQVSTTIMKGLAVRPDDRWQTMTEMLEPFREAEQRRLKK